MSIGDGLEDALAARSDFIHATDDSPERFEIMKEEAKRGRFGPPPQMYPIMIPAMLGIHKSLRSVKDNPAFPKTKAGPAFLEEVEALALKLGASSVGYTRVPARWVFRDKAIAFDNAIVLTMEMDKERVATAPSMACEMTVMEVYRDLGRVSIRIAEFLRERGYGAHPGHPLMGLTLYPPLAQMAGLGWLGLNGLIITPEHGPRVRLAAVFTSIENLPVGEGNPHAWVADFCSTCKVCIKRCPPGALYDNPVDHGNGQVTYVDNEACFPYFCDNFGCSVCIASCPFHRAPYDTLKAKFAARSGGVHERVAELGDGRSGVVAPRE
jgi:epoxyqueuosine reductase